MTLSNKSINEFKDLINRYQDKVFDMDALNDIVSILESESALYGKFKCEFDGLFDGATDLNTGIVHMCPEKLFTSNNKDSISVIDNEFKIDAINAWIIATFIHEASHVIQYLYLNDIITDNEEITKLYQKIYESSDSLRFKLFYHYYNLKFSSERYANLNGFYNTGLIVDKKQIKDFLDICYLYVFLEGYYLNLISMKSPVTTTLKMIGKKYDFDDDKLSLSEKLLHGFKLTKEEYHDIITPYDGLIIKDASIEPIIKKIYK